MLDIGLIRENPKEVAAALKKRDSQIELGALLELDEQRRELLQQVEGLRANQNTAAKEQDIESGGS